MPGWGVRHLRRHGTRSRGRERASPPRPTAAARASTGLRDGPLAGEPGVHGSRGHGYEDQVRAYRDGGHHRGMAENGTPAPSARGGPGTGAGHRPAPRRTRRRRRERTSSRRPAGACCRRGASTWPRRRTRCPHQEAGQEREPGSPKDAACPAGTSGGPTSVSWTRFTTWNAAGPRRTCPHGGDPGDGHGLPVVTDRGGHRGPPAFAQASQVGPGVRREGHLASRPVDEGHEARLDSQREKVGTCGPEPSAPTRHRLLDDSNRDDEPRRILRLEPRHEFLDEVELDRMPAGPGRRDHIQRERRRLARREGSGQVAARAGVGRRGTVRVGDPPIADSYGSSVSPLDLKSGHTAMPVFLTVTVTGVRDPALTTGGMVLATHSTRKPSSGRGGGSGAPTTDAWRSSVLGRAFPSARTSRHDDGSAREALEHGEMAAQRRDLSGGLPVRHRSPIRSSATLTQCRRPEMHFDVPSRR